MVTKASFALEQHLRAWTWRFGRSDGSIVHPSIEFLRLSRVKGPTHDNEFSWVISDGAVEFRTSDGRTTTRFDVMEGLDRNGVPTFSGAYVGAGANRDLRHTLTAHEYIGGPRGKKDISVCLVVPIHPPYFGYGVNLIVQSLFAEYRLCFIFTSHDDRINFASMIQDGPTVDYLWIVLENHVSKENLAIVNEKHSFPTMKKLWAIHELSSEFEYIVCVDAETFILRDHGWRARCAEIFDRKYWRGGCLKPAMRTEKEVLRASACNLAPECSADAMHDLVTQIAAYTWWWDLPVYRMKNINRFFEWLHWDDQTAILQKIDYFVFDHICYQYYLALEEGFKIQRIDEVVHSMEFSNASIVKKADLAGPKCAWVNARAYMQDAHYFQSMDYLAVYHLDRKYFPQYTSEVP